MTSMDKLCRILTERGCQWNHMGPGTFFPQEVVIHLGELGDFRIGFDDAGRAIGHHAPGDRAPLWLIRATEQDLADQGAGDI
jgi:hypothetical protein